MLVIYNRKNSNLLQKMNHSSPTNITYNHTPLSARLEHLVGNTFRSDFTFIIEDDRAEIPAHKLIIALASPVLDRIVYGNDSFAPSDSITVDGISKESFMQILHFIYTDNITINDDNVFEILHKSSYFGLPGIEAKCLEYLDKNLNVSSVPWIYHQLFYTISSSDLYKKCLQYIRIQPLKLFTSEYFEKMNVDELRPILQMDAINCTEIDLFEAVIKLSRALCAAEDLEVTRDNQRKVLEGAERLLRLETLTESELDKCLEIQIDFYSSTEIERIRADIRSPPTVPTTVKRKWYTYQDATWIEITRPVDMPPSAYYSGHRIFIFRSVNDDDDTPQISSQPELLTGERNEVLCGSGYVWRKSVNGEIPFGSVSISPIHAEPVFIARGLSISRGLSRHHGMCIGPLYMNGQATLEVDMDQSFSSDESLDDIDRLHEERSEFEVLVADNVKHPYNGHDAPNDAIFIGCDENDKKMYLGRAWYRNDLLPANVNLALGTFVPYGTRAERVQVYEFVRMDPGTYDWEEDSNGRVPANAVIAGCTTDGETLYFGRTTFNGKYVSGKIHPSHKVLYVPYGDEEINFATYDVLVHSEN